MDTLTTATVNRSCLQNLFKSDPTLCQHMERVHAQLVGGSDAPCFDSDNPEEFRLFLGCPSDAIAYYLDMHMREWITALQRTIPAVEIWIEGPEYGVILSLAKMQMLDLERNLLGENMVASTLDRPTESTVEQQTLSITESEPTKSRPDEQGILQLRDFAEGINQPESEIVKIMGTMRLPAFAQPDGTWGINEDDAYLIIRHRVKRIKEQRLNPSSDTAVEQTHGSAAPTTRRGRTAKTRDSLEGSSTKSTGLIDWKTKPNQLSIKDTAEETLAAILKKIKNYTELQVCQGLVRENELGQELMTVLQPLFNKKQPNGKVNQFFNKLKEAAAKRLKAMGLETEVAA